MHEAGALAGTRILLLGDDDLVSVAIARFTGLHGTAGPGSPATHDGAVALPAAGVRLAPPGWRGRFAS